MLSHNNSSTCFCLHVVLSVTTLLCSAGIAGAAEPAQPHESAFAPYSSPQADPDSAFILRGAVIDLPLSKIIIEEAVCVPSTAVEGRRLEGICSGSIRFQIRTNDAIERQQLELFTNSEEPKLKTDTFRWFAWDTPRQLVAPENVNGTHSIETASVLESWNKWKSDKLRLELAFDVVAAASARGDSQSQHLLILSLDTLDHGHVVYRYDPAGLESVDISNFVPAELDEPTLTPLENIRKEMNQRGRALRLEPDKFGSWDTWLSQSPVKVDYTSKLFLEPTHYDIDWTLTKPDMRGTGFAKITLKRYSDSALIRWHLMERLQVTDVRYEGKTIPWTRRSSQLLTLLPEQGRTSASIILEIDFRGNAHNEIEFQVYKLENRTAWYPRTGILDRATYDAHFRWPKGDQLISSGKVLESGKTKETRWSHAVLEQPGFGFSYEIGEFVVGETRFDDVSVTIAFEKAAGLYDSRMMKSFTDFSRRVFADLETTYGEYDRDHLTLIFMPGTDSRSLPGYIALPLTGRLEKRLVHEFTHQWWGNRIGWKSYRDYWLSEALADYSAADYFGVSFKSGYMNTSRHGRPYALFGPVVLGNRLLSSKSDYAYYSIVWAKGSAVFAMLARALTDDELKRMLRTLYESAGNRLIDTPTFIRAIEKMSGIDLTNFSDHFIFGTDVSEIYYDYSIDEAADGFEIRGNAQRVGIPDIQYSLERTRNGWDIVREGREVRDGFRMLAPFTITSGDKKFASMLTLDGDSTSFVIPFHSPVDEFQFDVRNETVAEFYNSQKYPLILRAWQEEELIEQGKFKAAEILLEDVLSREVEIPKPVPSGYTKPKVFRSLGIFLKAKIQLDQQNDAEAQRLFNSAVKLVGGQTKSFTRRTQFMVSLRLHSRAGNWKEAFDLCKKNLSLHLERKSDESVFQSMKKADLDKGWKSHGDFYALYAVAAHQLGKHDIARAAAKEARRRSVDLGEFSAIIRSGTSD